MARTTTPHLTRRNFVKASAAAAAALQGIAMCPFSRAIAQAAGAASGETVTTSACTVMCGSRCIMRVVSKDNTVIRIEPDNVGIDGCTTPHVLPCVRGRATRQRIYSAERLKYPLKRVGKRGEGKFERIGWDEALDLVAAKLKHVIETYGNDDIHYNRQSGLGTWQLVAGRTANVRLLNLLGGYLNQYGAYSFGQLEEAGRYTYGDISFREGSTVLEAGRAALYVAFGSNLSVVRASGGGQSYEYECAVRDRKQRVIHIDPIYTDSMLGKEDEWVPIRLGTDAALCEAIAYVLITENLVDQPFLDKYCVGYDEKTLPASAPKGSDYKSYILGNGPDRTPKTPQWATRITQIPVDTIVRIAREIGTVKPAFISQGYGSQRQANGEQTARAIFMLPILTGNIGLPGTNIGAKEGGGSGWMGDVWLPSGNNPIKATIPFFKWVDAVERGDLTAKADGVRGVERLRTPIKFIWNFSGNTLINQHSDINRTRKVLEDESKVEFILVIDNQMSVSARWADVILPDLAQQENYDYVCNASTSRPYVVAMQPAVKPRYEERSAYEICRGLAQRFGVEDKYTEGRTQEQWVEWCYETMRKKLPELPPFAEFWKAGVVKVENKIPERAIALSGFRKDPEKNKLKTPSGKIEIYSEQLAKLAREWELPAGDVISPLPQYVETWEMHGDPKAKQYPLQAFGYHAPGHTHSTFANLPWLREHHPDLLLINPVDAGKRGIANGDQVLVFNDRGALKARAKVTPRIIPGLVTLPQGGWYNPDKDGVDHGASINTLTSLRPSPLGKHNPQHTNLVEVRKA